MQTFLSIFYDKNLHLGEILLIMHHQKANKAVKVQCTTHTLTDWLILTDVVTSFSWLLNKYKTDKITQRTVIWNNRNNFLIWRKIWLVNTEKFKIINQITKSFYNLHSTMIIENSHSKVAYASLRWWEHHKPVTASSALKLNSHWWRTTIELWNIETLKWPALWLPGTNVLANFRSL